MTNKQIALMALEGRRPPRLPVTLVAGGSWYVHHAGQSFAALKNDPAALAEVFVRAFRDLGHDMLWTGAGLLNYPVHCLGAPIQDQGSDSPALLGAAISDLGELGSLDLEAALAHPVLRNIILSHHLVADAIGQETLILPTGWGPLTTAGRILGLEAVLMAMVEEPQALHGLLAFSTELIWELNRRILAHPDIPGLNLSDPAASGDLISPESFREFAAPYLAELVGRARALGKRSMIHICGDASRVLEDILALGPDGFSLEAKVELGLARRVLGGRVCVVGNLSPTGVFLSGGPEEVRREAQACVQAWGDGPGFMLSVGCDFPREVPLENIQALMSMKDGAYA
ncbi:MAG: hypothetical protein C4525_16105 [Desulfarculus sp.]|nr:MAG: hypothetical protein C4525_16105 [Desulfarculus sp.]